MDVDGWKISKEEGAQIISGAGETLVVNHNQLKALGLVTDPMSVEAFRKKFELGEKAPETKVAAATADSKFAGHIKFDSKGPNTIGLIRIDDKKSTISQSTWIYVKSALEYYKKNPPRLIILDLNTPGGEVFAAQKISDALKDFDTQQNIPVVAFINNWAISAGAMLTYSCRFITTTKDGSMGAAEPVHLGEGGQMVTASEKVNSALRTDFANRARFFDRDPNIAEAMVDKDIILVKRYGKIIRLDKEDQIRASGPNPDLVITSKGKLLTLSAQEMIDYGVADLLLQPAKFGPYHLCGRGERGVAREQDAAISGAFL